MYDGFCIAGLLSCKTTFKLEIMAGKRSTVQSSPKKFKIDDSILDDASSSKVEVVTIEEVMNLAINQCVTVVGKVVRVDAAMEVNSKESKVLMKQDCILSDSNGSCRVVLWQGDIGKLKEGQCYRMCRVSVRRYGVNYLVMSESTEVEEVADIGDVFCDDEEEIVPGGKRQSVAEGEIAAVLCVDDYSSCVSCRGKVRAISSVVGNCMKCNAKVKLTRCRKSKSVRFVVNQAGGKTWQLAAFDVGKKFFYQCNNGTNVVKDVHKTSQ